MAPELHTHTDTITLHTGDTLEVLRTLPDQSVNCIVTSPPYFGLRDYGTAGQYGAEPTLADYVETMRAVFHEARRVLSDTGTLWLNLGDSYGRGNKQLLGTPWRVAFALQDDGWILRNDIIWEKPNAMPESVADRLSSRYEHVFMFSKSRKYYFDLDAIRVPHAEVSVARAGRSRITPYAPPGQSAGKKTETVPNAKGKNPGDVWQISTTGFPEAHFATFPLELPTRTIKAGCPENGTVLDPFSGSGTTGQAALDLKRAYIGIDINPEYHDLALRTRLKGHHTP